MGTDNASDKISEAVVVVTWRTVKPGYEENFESAVHEFIANSLHTEGQLGVHAIRPAPGSGSREYGIVRRFANAEARDRFYQGELFQRWEQTVAPLIEGGKARQELSGLETWFTLPGQRSVIPPPRWKMAIVTSLGVYPVSLLVPWLLRPIIGELPPLVQSLFITVGIVALLTWAVMPLLVRILRAWLRAS